MNRISELRTQMGITMKEAAARLGMPYTTYVNYEKGTREPNSETLIQLARFFGTTIDNLLGKTPAPIPPGFQPMPEMSAVPLVGRIACGQPITAEQNVEGIVSVPAAWHATFTLLCQGDSMAPSIRSGDLVAIRSQPQVENGEIAAVRIGEEATLKRFYRQGDTVMLQAENPAFSPLVYTRDQLNEITIEGRVVGICRGT